MTLQIISKFCCNLIRIIFCVRTGKALDNGYIISFSHSIEKCANRAKMIDCCGERQVNLLNYRVYIYTQSCSPHLPEEVDFLAHLGYLEYMIVKKLVVGTG